MKYDVCVIGDINIDIILKNLEKKPVFENQEVVEDFSMNLGGSSALFACSASNLGLKTYFQGCLGKDFFGDFLIDKLKENKVKFKIKRKNSIKTGITLAFGFKDGKKSFVSSLPNNWSLKNTDIDFSILKNSKHLHISGLWHLKSIDIISILKFARNLGLSTSIDVGATIEEENWKKLDKIIENVDVFFLNEKEKKWFGKPIKDILKKTKITALHMREKGTKVYSGKETVFVPAKKIKVINPVGAGDNYDAGFIYGFLKGQSIEECAKLAVSASSYYISKKEQEFMKI